VNKSTKTIGNRYRNQ